MKKNVVVRQVDLQDCGACCILSVIRYYEGNMSLEQIKLDTFTSKEGTSAFHIIEALKKYGFDATGKKLALKNLDYVKLPVIAHIEVENSYNHYVVIYKLDFIKKRVLLMDPAQGLKEMTFSEFLKIWSNVIIELYPQSKIPNIPINSPIKKILIDLLNSEKENLFKLIISSSLLSILIIINTFYFKILIKNTDNNFQSLIWLIVLYIVMTILKTFLTYIRDYYENFLNKNIDVRIMLPFLYHLFKLPLNIISNRTTGEIVTRVGEINNIKDLFTKCFVTIFLDLLLVIVSAIILYNISSKLFGILLLVCIAYSVIGLLYSSVIYKMVVENIELESKFNNEVIERVDSFLTIKDLNKTEYVCQKIENSYCYYIKKSFNFNKILINNNFIKNLVNDLGLCIIISLGCILIYKNSLSLLNLILFNTLLVYMLDPIKNIINLLPKINYIKASIMKINEFISLKEENNKGTYNEFVNGDILIENLCYSYNNYNDVYKNFNLKIKQGKKVIIKGPSGCGKSTFCKLLYRLYDFKAGNIKISNINILDYDLNVLRDNISYLAQNEKLFTDTIYNNIILDNNITTYEFNYIAKMCAIDKIVDKKPLRYETMINASCNFSGGEIQRILLARTLVKNAPILILDEALSQVDQSLEKEILRNIINYYSDKTIIYISHRDNEELFDQIIKFKNVSVL